MFDTVRKWAYKAIRAHRGGIYNTWLDEVIKHCLSVNEAFLEALPYSEIKATAKSIATYCWKKDAYCYQEFIDRQSRKGVFGGKKSNSSHGGIARSRKYNEKRERALELRNKGFNNKEISLEIGVTTRTLRNWFLK
jgi:hypothetical protein